MEKMEASYVASGNIKWYLLHFVVPQKIKYKVIMQSNNPARNYMSKRIKKYMFTQKIVHKCS